MCQDCKKLMFVLYEFGKIIGDDNCSIRKCKSIGANKTAMPEFNREGKVIVVRDG
jgi:hypothetical protein